MADIRAYLRRVGNSDQAILNKILTELQEIQPEVKGENATEIRIIKGTEFAEIRTALQTKRHNDRLLLEDGSSFLLTESDKYIYTEVNTIRRLLLETDDIILLETGDNMLLE